MRRHWTSLALLLLSAYTPGAADAQLEISSRASSIRIGGRAQAQYSLSSVPRANNDFFFRRVRLLVDISVNDFVSARIQPDFAGGRAALQDTYVRLDFSSAFRLSVGQFKRAYDLFEMSSSTDLSLIERDARIEGVSSCAGVGSVCSYSRLTESLGFAGRDQGVRLEGSSGRISYKATVTNGTGVNVPDENDSKSYSARLTLEPAADVRISGQMALHDYEYGDERTGRAKGWGLDIEIGGWRDGFLLMGAVTGGDNWRLLGIANQAASFLATQVVASYFHAIDSPRFSGIEPLFRVSLGDPDTGVNRNGATVITPGLMLYFEGKNKIGANLDLYSPRVGASELSLKVQTFLYF